MCPCTSIIGVEFSLIASCVTRGLVELRTGARTEMRRSGAGGETCGWIIQTGGFVGFSCFCLGCIEDRRMCLGIVTYILQEFKAIIFIRVVFA